MSGSVALCVLFSWYRVRSSNLNTVGTATFSVVAYTHKQVHIRIEFSVTHTLYTGPTHYT